MGANECTICKKGWFNYTTIGDQKVCNFCMKKGGLCQAYIDDENGRKVCNQYTTIRGSYRIHDIFGKRNAKIWLCECHKKEFDEKAKTSV